MDAQARRPYSSDLTDAQWAILEPLLPPPVTAGAPRRTNFREVLNAIFYVLTNGCAWHALPHDFPPEGTCDYFHRWRRCGLWEQIHNTLRCQVREHAGKEPEPRPAASTARRSRRHEPVVNGDTTRGKKINGVKRHILVDTLGLVLAVVVHPANIQDRDGAKLVFAKAMLKGPWPRMERVWADGGYAGKLIDWVCSFCQWVLEIVKRSDDVKGFKLLPSAGWSSGPSRGCRTIVA